MKGFWMTDLLDQGFWMPCLWRGGPWMDHLWIDRAWVIGLSMAHRCRPAARRWARLAPLGLGVASLWIAAPSVAAEGPCDRPRADQPLTLSPLLLPAGQPASDPAGDYRHRLQTTALGWPLQSTWCVWVDPGEPGSAAALTSDPWQQAVARALAEWGQLLSIQRVPVPERAQVTLWRRRPPLGLDPTGRPRASHGRAILSLHAAGASASQRVEPRVRVLISPGQRAEAIQATALHELGHAFGLWGHSDDPEDAMAASPGQRPILRLSARDKATVRWLYAQPAPMRSDP